MGAPVSLDGAELTPQGTRGTWQWPTSTSISTVPGAIKADEPGSRQTRGWTGQQLRAPVRRSMISRPARFMRPASPLAVQPSGLCPTGDQGTSFSVFRTRFVGRRAVRGRSRSSRATVTWSTDAMEARRALDHPREIRSRRMASPRLIAFGSGL